MCVCGEGGKGQGGGVDVWIHILGRYAKHEAQGPHSCRVNKLWPERRWMFSDGSLGYFISTPASTLTFLFSSVNTWSTENSN